MLAQISFHHGQSRSPTCPLGPIRVRRISASRYELTSTSKPVSLSYNNPLPRTPDLSRLVKLSVQVAPYPTSYITFHLRFIMRRCDLSIQSLP